MFPFPADHWCERHLSSFGMSAAAWKYLGVTCRLLALGWLIPGLGASNFARHQDAADVSGTYQGRAAAKDPARRVYTLTLSPDGTASLATLYIGKDETTEPGHWIETGNQIVLTLNAMGGNQPPGPITFRHRNHELWPKRWDANEWGRTGPPVLRRSRR